MGIAIIFAVAYNMLLGETGMLSFGHAVYFGLGGYTAIHLLRVIAAGLVFPVALLPLVGGLGGLFFGLLFGYLSTRRGGTAFAMITLGLMELVVALALIFDHLFGGEEGISGNRTSGPALFGSDFGSQLQVYYLIGAWMLVSLALMRAFTRTPVGRLCNAVRDNPERVQFIGYDPARIRLIAFAVSSFFAGVAGGLFAVNYELMSLNSLGAERSALVLLMAYIGGIGSFLGPVVGAVLVTFLQVALSDYTQAWHALSRPLLRPRHPVRPARADRARPDARPARPGRAAASPRRALRRSLSSRRPSSRSARSRSSRSTTAWRSGPSSARS